MKLTGVDAGMIVDMPECDTEGNFYLRNAIDFHSPILPQDDNGRVHDPWLQLLAART